MMYITLIIFMQVSSLLAAPLQFPLLQPLGTIQQQQLALQEQLLALQQFQALQRFNQPTPLAMNPSQPILLLLPNTKPNIEQHDRYTQLNENLKSNTPTQEIEDDNTDSITVDAEPEDSNRVDAKNAPMRAILLVPNNARFSLGGFISSIPFLPFEINVPDSISWIYNGISGIISGIGQSWPFNRPQMGESQSEVNMKSVWKGLKRNNVMPIVVMPLGQPMVPMPV